MQAAHNNICKRITVGKKTIANSCRSIMSTTSKCTLGFPHRFQWPRGTAPENDLRMSSAEGQQPHITAARMTVAQQN
jgi:hypothetical protein